MILLESFTGQNRVGLRQRLELKLWGLDQSPVSLIRPLQSVDILDPKSYHREIVFVQNLARLLLLLRILLPLNVAFPSFALLCEKGLTSLLPEGQCVGFSWRHCILSEGLESLKQMRPMARVCVTASDSYISIVPAPLHKSCCSSSYPLRRVMTYR